VNFDRRPSLDVRERREHHRLMRRTRGLAQTALIFVLTILAVTESANAQRTLNSRTLEGVEQISLGCRGAIRQKLPAGTRPMPSGEAKLCTAAIVAPAGYVLLLTGRENANAPKNNNSFGRDGSLFRYGLTGCEHGSGFGQNCPTAMSRPSYVVAVPMECSTTGGRSDVSTPDISGRVTLTYRLIPEAEARAKDRFLGPRPATISFGKLTACP
jgi:hypothetical protein